MIMRFCLLLAVAGALIVMAHGALAEDIDLQTETGYEEEDLIQAIREGRVSSERFLEEADKISFMAKMRLLYYGTVLEKYIRGVDNDLRRLAWADPNSPQLLAQRSRELGTALEDSYRRFLADGREHPKKDWRRLIVSLIWIHQDWRRRVKDEETGEIKNFFELVPLMDCVDGIVRGKSRLSYGDCPAGPKRNSQREAE